MYRRILRVVPVLIVFAVGLFSTPLAAEECRPAEATEAQTFTLFVAGDVCPAYHIKNGHVYDPGFFTPAAQTLIESHDMSIVNYETATHYDNPVARSKKFVFKASPDAPAGMNFLSAAATANNHAFDYGVKGWEATDKALTRAGILHNGVFHKRAGYSPLRFHKAGWEIILVTGTIWGSSLGEYATLSPEGIVKELRKIAEGSAGVFTSPKRRIVVYIHGDEEYKKKTKRQVDWSRRFAAAGADVVLWAHSHVYGPVEQENSTLVAYGLGNFLFGGNGKWRNRKGIEALSLEFSVSEKTKWKKVLFESRNYCIDLQN